MKRGHYYNQAEKSFKILDKFHTKMFDHGGEESEHWSDDFNGRESCLRRSLEAGKDDNAFVLLEKHDQKMSNNDEIIDFYQEKLKDIKSKIKHYKQIKIDLQKEKSDLIEEFDMDYKTIEKRLLNEFPEFAPWLFSTQ